MKLSLHRYIYFFTFTSCLFFIMLVSSFLWSIQVVEVALERGLYANKVENHTNILKQLISSEDIYADDYNTKNWLALDRKFNRLLRQAPSLTPHQQTLQNSIVSQNTNVHRLFNVINKNKLKYANDKTKKHLRIRLMTQLEAISSDSMQLFDIIKKDIDSVIKQQVTFILSLLFLSLFILIYGAFKLVKIFKSSLNEIKFAFSKNRCGNFQEIQLSNQSEEFSSIANAFNDMNQELSETTISLESMTKIVAERTQALEQLSNTDSLTNVANRRALFERGNAEFSRVQRTNSLLSVAVLDCDFFKAINDKYGHGFGDQILQHICKICTKEIRDIDFFSRYGGEEFIILLPESDVNGAEHIAKRIQQALAINGVSFEGKDVYVTLSIGICAINKHHSNFEHLIKDADTAMYKAKNNGRNRIEIISENLD